MNLEQMRKRLQELLMGIGDLQAKDGITEEEIKSLDGQIEEAKGLKSQIEAEERRLHDVGELQSFAKTTVESPPVVSKDGSGQQDQNKPSGTDVYGTRKDGSYGLLHSDDPLLGQDKFLAELASNDYRKNFILTLKGGERDPYRHLDKDGIKMMEGIRRKAASIGIEEDGGFLAPPQYLNEIIRQKPGQTAIMDMVRKQPTTSAKLNLLRLEDSGDNTYTNTGLRIAWTGEGNSPTSQNQPKLKPFGIDVHEGEIEVALTRTFLEDAPGAVESYIGTEMRTSFDLGMENTIVNGTGIGQPFGMFTRAGEVYGPDTVNVGNPATAAGLIDAHYSLPAQYAAGAAYVMRRDVFGDLQQIEDGAGNLIFGLQATFDGLAVSAREQMRGTPIKFSDFTEASGSAKKIALYGNFGMAYMLALRLGLTARMRDIAGQQPAVVFRFRVGGDVMLGRAMKILVQS